MRFSVRRCSKSILFVSTIIAVGILRRTVPVYRLSNTAVNTTQTSETRYVVNCTSPLLTPNPLTPIPSTNNGRSTLLPSYRQPRFSSFTFQPSCMRPSNFSADRNEWYRERFLIRQPVLRTDESDSIWWWSRSISASRPATVRDRIVQQINYVPRSYRQRLKSNTTSMKTIYVPGGGSGVPEGRVKFFRGRCLVDACTITTNPLDANSSHLRLLRSDADFFLPSQRLKPLGQIWAIQFLESPANMGELHHVGDLINWTATFRLDSTFVTPYAKFVPYSFTSTTRTLTATVNYASGKSKLVAWFVSNCNPKNERGFYVEELSRHVPVDVFGVCGKQTCQRSDKNCWSRLRRDYKFYISFENSNCDSYITEKFFENALSNDVVPIVMGGRRQDYERSSPPHSYIFAGDFSTAGDLADYLLQLNQSDVLYNEYFQWKGSGDFINTKFWCRLCAMLHDDDKPVMWYSDLNQWWSHAGTCRRQNWDIETEAETANQTLL